MLRTSSDYSLVPHRILFVSVESDSKIVLLIDWTASCAVSLITELSCKHSISSNPITCGASLGGSKELFIPEQIFNQNFILDEFEAHALNSENYLVNIFCFSTQFINIVLTVASSLGNWYFNQSPICSMNSILVSNPDSLRRWFLLHFQYYPY